jgi:hypothetical protein
MRPAQFAHSCRHDCFAAIDLVRGFSQLSLQSRSLWSSLRGPISQLKTLGIMNGKSQRTLPQPSSYAVPFTDSLSDSSRGIELSFPYVDDIYPLDASAPTNFVENPDGTPPVMNSMGDDLIDMFDTFGMGYCKHDNPSAPDFPDQSDLFFSVGSAGNLSQYFISML